MKHRIRVTVWNEFEHEKEDPSILEMYPGGLHGYIADFLTCDEVQTRTATLQEPEHGLTEEVLANTDVLVWWGHRAHQKVEDEIVARVRDAVLRGMGLIVLHSGHESKIFKALMGTSCSLKWREGARERVWTVLPAHPIAQGVPDSFSLDPEEMYGEAFDIPNPDEVVFMGWFNGGEVFRSGCTFHRGYGKIFYFQPGHETYPSFRNEHVQRILQNAVRWARPTARREELKCTRFEPLEN
jgi:trehalose utilization protein